MWLCSKDVTQKHIYSILDNNTRIAQGDKSRKKWSLLSPSKLKRMACVYPGWIYVFMYAIDTQHPKWNNRKGYCVRMDHWKYGWSSRSLFTIFVSFWDRILNGWTYHRNIRILHLCMLHCSILVHNEQALASSGMTKHLNKIQVFTPRNIHNWMDASWIALNSIRKLFEKMCATENSSLNVALSELISSSTKTMTNGA